MPVPKQLIDSALLKSAEISSKMLVDRLSGLSRNEDDGQYSSSGPSLSQTFSLESDASLQQSQNEMFEYTVEVVTGSPIGSGTNSVVFVTLIEENIESEEFWLHNSIEHGDDINTLFETGTTETFKVKSNIEFRKLQNVRVRIEGNGLGHEWLLDHIVVTGGGLTNPVRFNCGLLLTSEQPIVDLFPEPRPPERIFEEKAVPVPPSENQTIPNRNLSHNTDSAKVGQQFTPPTQKPAVLPGNKYSISPELRIIHGLPMPVNYTKLESSSNIRRYPDSAYIEVEGGNRRTHTKNKKSSQHKKTKRIHSKHNY
jgi:hypothetical protein